MIQLECSRTTIKNPFDSVSNLNCEQNLEIAILVNYLLSGFSFSVALLCLYHLIKRFKYRLAHYIILAFSFLLVISNIISLVLLTQSYHTYIHFTLAAASIGPDGKGNATFPGPSLNELIQSIGDRAFAQDLYLPIFFWVTDAFLLYRAWVIWHGKRWVLAFPYFLYFASLVSGIICQALFSRTKFLETPWVPALSFSSAVDIITTGMIGGRLYFHHRRQMKLGITDSKFFISALVICIESGLMSTVSKLVQFAIPISDRALSVVPLVTIASNLIILRKALGADIIASISHNQSNSISDIRFDSRNRRQMSFTTSGGRGQVRTIQTLDTIRSPVSPVDSMVQYHSGRKRGDALATVDSVIDINTHPGDEKGSV